MSGRCILMDEWWIEGSGTCVRRRKEHYAYKGQPLHVRVFLPLTLDIFRSLWLTIS